MTNWYGYATAAGAGLKGAREGMRYRREEERREAEETRKQSQEERAQKTFERTEKEARSRELRAQAEEERKAALHELSVRSQKIDIESRTIQNRLDMATWKDKAEAARLDARLKDLNVEKGEAEAAIRAIAAAAQGVEPGPGASKAANQAFKKYMRGREMDAMKEGIQNALPLLLGGEFRAAEQIFNSVGSLRIAPGTLKPTDDPNDPEWMFQYTDADTGQLVSFSAQAQAGLLGGGIGPSMIGGEDIRFLPKAEWQQRQKDVAQQQRTQITYGSRGSRTKRNLYQTAQQMVADKVVADVQEGLMILQGKDRAAQIRMTADNILKAAEDPLTGERVTTFDQAWEAATKYIDQVMFPGEGAGVEPPPAGAETAGAGAGAAALADWEAGPAPKVKSNQDLINIIIGNSGAY